MRQFIRFLGSVTDKPVSRTLAVLLHADVAGSTALVQRDETLAHTRITEAFRRLTSTVEQYGGTVHEVRGDALVAEFSRPSDAVSAALAFQNTNAKHNAQLSDGVTPVMRMGISLGEVVIADETVTGAGIVLAQRLEQLNEPGGVCIQQAVYEALPRRLPFAYDPLPEQQLKGFDRPVRAYGVTVQPGMEVPPPEPRPVSKKSLARRHGAIAIVTAMAFVVIGALAWWQPWKPDLKLASDEQMTLSLPDKPSIVVLPFNNMSDDASQEYFADGMTEDLITDLSKVSGLFVIARSSSFLYKDKDLDVRQAARELGVRYVLEGSVRKAGGRIRINAQLIDATTGGHLWAERYDRELIDIFDLQNEVIEHIVTALAVRFTPQDISKVGHRSTNDVTAYDHFLRGQALARTSNYEQARAAFQEAIAADSGFARAYGALSATYAFGVQDGWSTNPQSDIEQASALARKAAAIDADVPQVQFALSLAHFINRAYTQAIDAARRAIELDPSYADAFGLLAWIHCYAGDPQEALRVVERTKRLSPHLNAATLHVFGLAHFLAGHLKKATEIFEVAREANPELMVGRIYLTALLIRSGRQEDAEWEATEILTLNPDFSVERWARTQPYQDLDQLSRLGDDLRRAGLPE
jgi:adenylate cyclase